MSLDTALLAARSGLLHTQRALAASAGNVANAETVGYTRKTVDGQGHGGQRRGDRRAFPRPRPRCR